MIRYLLCVTGLLLSLPILVFSALTFRLPITISGIGYLFGSLIAVSGLILAPWMPRRYIVLTTAGLTVIAFVASTRLILAGQQADSRLRMITLPEEKNTRWINYLLDEQDSLIFGEEIFHRIGGDSVEEHKDIMPALYTAYSQMRTTRKVFPSPFLSTYLNLQTPAHFDAVIMEPEINQPPEFAVVFLHGYMGNVTAQCWAIAGPVRTLGGVTICPSTDWQGRWWQSEGPEILQSTFEYLKERGIQKFYLGGFSNGGFGIGRLASQLRSENGLSGLIFIDGFADAMIVREIGLPVLILQGAQDERVPAEAARQFAADIGNLGTYVELDGDHFLIMKQPGGVQNAIANWLGSLESYP